MTNNVKRFLLVVLSFVLFGCSAKKEDFYALKVNDKEIVVGYDQTVEEDIPADYLITSINKKEVVSKLTYYIDDLNGDTYIDNYKLSSIKEACDYFSGDYIEKNGHACVFGKIVNDHDNYVILYSDILSDDLDQIDRVEIYYE